MASDSGDEVREYHVYRVKRAFKPSSQLDKYLLSFYLTVTAKELVIVRTRADQGEWVHVSRTKKPQEDGYVPWDFIGPLDEGEDEQRYIDEYKRLSEAALREATTDMMSLPGQRAVIAWRNIQSNSDFVSRNRGRITKFAEYAEYRDQWVAGFHHFASEQYEEAIETFVPLAILLSNANLCFNLGVCFFQLKNHGHSIFWFVQALRLNPEFTAAIVMRGVCYYKQSDYLLAALDFSRALDLFRKNVSIDYRPLKLNWTLAISEVYYNRALAYAAMGITERALEDVTQAMRYRHDHPEHYIIGRLRSELTFLAGEQASSYLGPHGLPVAMLQGLVAAQAVRRPPPSAAPSKPRRAAKPPANPFMAEILARRKELRGPGSGGGGAEE